MSDELGVEGMGGGVGKIGRLLIGVVFRSLREGKGQRTAIRGSTPLIFFLQRVAFSQVVKSKRTSHSISTQHTCFSTAYHPPAPQSTPFFSSFPIPPLPPSTPGVLPHKSTAQSQ